MVLVQIRISTHHQGNRWGKQEPADYFIFNPWIGDSFFFSQSQSVTVTKHAVQLQVSYYAHGIASQFKTSMDKGCMYVRVQLLVSVLY